MKCHSCLLGIPAAGSVLTLSAFAGGGIAEAATASTQPSPSQSQSGPSAQDRSWLREAHQINLAEVAAGRLAQKKGATSAVRSAGKMIHTDHKNLDKKVTSTADALDVTLPKTVTPSDAAAAERLSKETGRTFDKNFLSTMVTGHKKAIADTKKETRNGSSPRVTHLAAQALPTLRKHLRTVQQAQSHDG